MSAAAAVAPASAKPRSGLATLLRSLLVNVVGAWLAFKLVSPHYPPHSMVPLLASLAVPLAYLLWELARRRTLDGVAVIQLTMTGLTALAGLLANDQRASLVAIAFQPLGLGLVFGASALLGRPLIQLLARQAMAGDDAEAAAGFDRAVAAIPRVRRRLAIISAMWTGVLACETGVRLVMVQIMPASSYILAANIMAYAVPGALVWLSMRLGRGLEARLDAERRLAQDRAAS